MNLRGSKMYPLMIRLKRIISRSDIQKLANFTKFVFYTVKLCEILG